MRGTRIELRPAALAHNARRAAALAPGAEVFAMVKADGYGHGLGVVARALADQVDGLGVAVVDEAVALRQLGLSVQILVAEGAFDRDELAVARQHQLQLVVHAPWQVEQLLAQPADYALWLKLNTGMNRLGMRPPLAREQAERLRQAGMAPAGLMTHFACADEVDDHLTERQLAAAQALAAELSLPLSCANSAALIRYPHSHQQRVRPGIMLYGSSPFAERSAASLGLQVTQRFSARLIACHDLQPGDSVGYGASWTASAPCRVGVVAVGYGDGYPRHAGTGTPVAVNGQRSRLVGRVSMDMLTIDLTDVPAKVGDEVELWGDTVSVDEVARACGTISYELFCQLTQRPERVITHP